MNQELKNTYVKNIEILFGGTVVAQPYQISEEVINIVDTMFSEITQCHKQLAPFAMTAELIATAINNRIPDEIKVAVGVTDIGEYLTDKSKNKVAEVFGAAKALNAFSTIKDIIDIWQKYTDSNRRMQVCINTARANWRSALEIELMGL